MAISKSSLVPILISNESVHASIRGVSYRLVESNSELFAMLDTHESQAHTINGHISAVETLVRIFREWRFLAARLNRSDTIPTAFVYSLSIVFS